MSLTLVVISDIFSLYCIHGMDPYVLNYSQSLLKRIIANYCLSVSQLA